MQPEHETTMNAHATQLAKGRRFRELHVGPDPFVIPNPWDAGTARLLELLGFQALTTTSAGLAFALGKRDRTGGVSREETIANARAIVEATDLPVAADLENGYGDAPQDVATTVRMAGEVAGLVGGSIEDATDNPAHPIYDFALAVERVAAAAEAAHSFPFPFMLVGRAENYLHGRPDLDDTIRRLQAFESAGADVLYAPGLGTADEIRAVCESVTRPVNVVMGLRGQSFSVVELRSLGVRRISVGSALCRAGLAAFLTAAREVHDRGTFEFAEAAIGYADVNHLMRERRV